MPDEQLVSFTLVFEDKATAALKDAQAVFDLTSSSFETAMREFTELLNGFEGGSGNVASFIENLSAEMPSISMGVSNLGMSFDSAIDSAGEFEEATKFLQNLETGAIDISFQEKEIKALGGTMGDAFTKNLEKTDLAGTLGQGMGDAVLEAELLALGQRKKDDFLSGKTPAASGGGTAGLTAALKPLNALGNIWSFLKNFALIGTIIGMVASVFGPFIEIMVDFIDTAMTPIAEFFTQIALESAPFWDDLAQAISMVATWAFPALIGIMQDYVVPGLQAAVQWVVKLAQWAWPLLTEFIEKHVVPNFIWLGGELVKFYETYMPELTKFINENVVPALEWLGEKALMLGKWFKENIQEILEFLVIPVLVILGIVLAKLTIAVLGFFAALLLNPFTLIVLAIAGVVYALKEWAGGWENLWEGTKQFFSNIYEGLSTAVTWVVDTVKGLWDSLTKWFKRGGSAVIEAIWEGMKAAFEALVWPGPIGAMVDKIRQYLPGSDAELGPLSDITQAGPGLVETFAEGVERTSPIAVRAVSAMADETHEALLSPGQKQDDGTAQGDPNQSVVDQLVSLNRLVEEAFRLIDTVQGTVKVRRELTALTGFSE